ncbi:trypsin-like peptidase domain-containing protein [Paraburkholderia terrae]|uniref:trypsin-like peptidase domain-containing protein n=1 Tax=Paraburkholderia terrae TaxID=311230 RepID=UPI003365B1D8
MVSGNLKSMLILAGVVSAISTGCSAQVNSPLAGRPMLPTEQLVQSHGPAILTDFSSIFQKDGQAVVNISATGAQHAATLNPLWPPASSAEDPFSLFFRQFSPGGAGPANGLSQSLGSGFIISSDGYVLTDSQIITDASKIRVKLADGRDFPATVVGNDPASGVALLKIPATHLHTVTIGSPSSTRTGNWVASIGSPYGLNNSMTAGIVSNTSRVISQYSYIPLIQTDMIENTGDSGGPLLDLNGDVIGIVAPVQDVIGNAQGLAFAIPIDEAMKVEQQLQQNHKAEHGRLGITIQEVSGPLARSFGLTGPQGALVSSVAPNGPSAQSGLRPGDVILRVNDITITDSAKLPVAVADLKPGRPVRLVYWRDHATHDTTVVLGKLNEVSTETTSSAPTIAPDGLTVRSLTTEEQHQAGVKGGVRVEKSAGPAALAGIQPGDIVVMVDSTPISSPAQFRQKVESSGRSVALLVQRHDQRMFVTIDVG